MNIRVKKAAAGIIVFLATVTFIKPASVRYETAVNADITGTDKIINEIKLDNLDSGKEDSLAVMGTQDHARKTDIQYKANDQKNMDRMGFKFSTDIVNKVRDFIDFGKAEEYSLLKGVTCFRGSNMRDGGSYGNADIKEEKLHLLWKKDIGSIDSWTGVGWNGQPSIVQWSPEAIRDMNINSSKKSVQGLKEVIYATLDGNVYFLDLEDGKETRSRLNIGAPVKGSLTVDPRGIPLLYVGQGIDTNGPRYVSFAYRIFSLADFSKLYEIKGNDSFARRNWGAFDSTALIDRYKDNIFICGENGIVYSGKLNTVYDNGKVSIKPSIDKYRYDAPGKDRKGIENSIAIYENYGFFCDNDGILQCLDLNSLTPVWTLEVNDDTDSTVILEREAAGLSLYTACEVDHQGAGGYSYVRKVDAASGRVLWENKYKCAYVDETNGGALATPVVGKNDIKNLVVFNIARTPEANSGSLIAFDKSTGKEVWKLRLPNYCWSSPLAVYNNNGKSYIVQCDSAGKAMLIEGISGRILDTIDLGANVEGSPAAFENKLVVGTRGSRIIGFEIR